MMQVFKLIFGGSMGLLTVPFIAYAALIAMGRLQPAGTGAAGDGMLHTQHACCLDAWHEQLPCKCLL